MKLFIGRFLAAENAVVCAGDDIGQSAVIVLASVMPIFTQQAGILIRLQSLDDDRITQMKVAIVMILTWPNNNNYFLIFLI